jgi:aspartyl-tRNA(Asn)/glutamyl-tRNA(Gln) amidotransferase subunit B
MDQGSLRCYANVSLKPAGSPVFGTRTETKNVNSLRSVEIAVRHEICRQGAVLTGGGRVVQETRHFEETSGTTKPGRNKETAEDYRYFPEPDLVPMSPEREWVERIRAQLPEMPWLHRRRLQSQWGFTDLEMRDLVAAGAVEFVEQTVAAGAGPGEAKAWMAYLGGKANEAGTGITELPITPAQVAAVAGLVSAGTLNAKLARQVVDGVLAGDGEPDEIVAERGLAVVSDDGALQRAVDDALAAQPAVAQRIRAGNHQAVGAVIGAVMKATKGQADAGRVRELVFATLGVSPG